MLFGKLFFPNVGGVVVDLEYQNIPFNPLMLPTGKKYNYYYANDIKYYDVKTPYTEFIYENGVKEGNFLSSTFSHNINKQFNYTFHYRGLISEVVIVMKKRRIIRLFFRQTINKIRAFQIVVELCSTKSEK